MIVFFTSIKIGLVNPNARMLSAILADLCLRVRAGILWVRNQIAYGEVGHSQAPDVYARFGTWIKGLTLRFVRFSVVIKQWLLRVSMFVHHDGFLSVESESSFIPHTTPSVKQGAYLDSRAQGGRKTSFIPDLL